MFIPKQQLIKCYECNYARYEQGQMGDAADFVEWASTIELR